MNRMFSHCSSLISLNVSNFDTSAVTSMQSMFSHCITLTSLDLSSFTNDKVIFAEDLFFNASKLTYIDIRKFKGPDKFNKMFNGLPDNEGKIVINIDAMDIVKNLIPQNWSIEIINITDF